MTDYPLGRRGADGNIHGDHDLLVRIDERLTIHLAAFTHFTLESVRDRLQIGIRLDVLEGMAREHAGAKAANARFIATVIALSGAFTGFIVGIVGHYWK